MGGKYRFDQIPPEERRRIAKACGLTEEETRVFEARARFDSVVQTSMRLNMSDRTAPQRVYRAQDRASRTQEKRSRVLSLHEFCRISSV